MKVLRPLAGIMIAGMLFGGFGPAAYSEPEAVGWKAAFIRDGDLWVKQGSEERKLTSEGHASAPKWSYDGESIAYTEGEEEQERELRVYSLRANKPVAVYRGAAYHYEWAPNRKRLAFQIGRVLNTADVGPDAAQPFVNVSLGVGNFSWLPDGSGFLVSSGAQLLPTGWTEVKLYKVPADAKLDRRKMKLFFTLPAESGDFFAVSTSRFKWSADRKWIALLAEPTASWSADSNTLCLLASSRLAWIRSDREHGEVWLARADGSGAERYICRIGAGSGYYESWSWDTVVAWYEPGVSARTTVAPPAAEQAPSYAKWGRLAMKETASRYKHAQIHDYRYIGRSRPDANTTEDRFKLWLAQDGREFGVYVSIRWETSTEKVVSVKFRESAT